MRTNYVGRSADIADFGRSMGHGRDLVSSEVVSGFLARTSQLTAGEQAEVLGAALEDAQSPVSPIRGAQPAPAATRAAPASPRPSQPASRSTGTTDFFSTFGHVAGGVQQGLGYFTQGAQAISSIASLFGGHDVARVAGQLAQGTGTAASMMQSLRGGRVPTMPGPSASRASPMGSAPTGAVPAATAPSPAQPTPSHAGGGQFDATALLGLLLSNPQLQQALRSIPVFGQARPLELTIPTETGEEAVSIPMHEMVGTVAELAGRSALELRAESGDAESPIAVGPPRDRAAVTLHYVRADAEARRFGESDEVFEDSEDSEHSEVWANEAGF